MSLLPSDVLYTPEEYLALERQAVEKHEDLDGQVYAMAGETIEHSTIGSNINASLNYQLRGKPCRVLQPNMKVRSRLETDRTTVGLFSYPDCLVVCGDPVFHDVQRDVLINPKVIIEVLSSLSVSSNGRQPGSGIVKSTEAYDRGEKFARYRQMDSFTDYLLVSQFRPSVEHFARQPNGDWNLHVEIGLGSSIVITSIGCSLRLGEIYDRITFAEDPWLADPIAGNAG